MKPPMTFILSWDKDSMMAATALTHGLTVATRNVGDFKKAGVLVVNPFD